MNPKAKEKPSPNGAAAGLPEWLTSFVPRRGLSNGHLQTIVGNYLPRPAFNIPFTAETVEVDPADGSRVLCHCHWQPEPASRLTLVLVHGLEGSSDSQYIRGIAARAWATGCNVVRMNMRNCGGSEMLTPTLYHSGLSADLGAVVLHFAERFNLKRVALVGYSMGGNLVLKLAGGVGAGESRFAPWPRFARPSTWRPDRTRCTSRSTADTSCIFLRNLMRRFHRKAKLFPEIYETEGIDLVRSLRQFGRQDRGPLLGFSRCNDYYARAAGSRVVDRIAVPTLLLCAPGRPFVRIVPETRAKLLANPQITLWKPATEATAPIFPGTLATRSTGAEAVVIRYLLTVTGESHGS